MQSLQKDKIFRNKALLYLQITFSSLLFSPFFSLPFSLCHHLQFIFSPLFSFLFFLSEFFLLYPSPPMENLLYIFAGNLLSSPLLSSPLLSSPLLSSPLLSSPLLSSPLLSSPLGFLLRHDGLLTKVNTILCIKACVINQVEATSNYISSSKSRTIRLPSARGTE